MRARRAGYQLSTGILESARKPYFSFRDFDENKPAGSLRIRIETIDYYLRHLNGGVGSDPFGIGNG